jgi:hypothetical protein
MNHFPWFPRKRFFGQLAGHRQIVEAARAFPAGRWPTGGSRAAARRGTAARRTRARSAAACRPRANDGGQVHRYPEPLPPTCRPVWHACRDNAGQNSEPARFTFGKRQHGGSEFEQQTRIVDRLERVLAAACTIDRAAPRWRSATARPTSTHRQERRRRSPAGCRQERHPSCASRRVAWPAPARADRSQVTKSIRSSSWLPDANCRTQATDGNACLVDELRIVALAHTLARCSAGALRQASVRWCEIRPIAVMPASMTTGGALTDLQGLLGQYTR